MAVCSSVLLFLFQFYKFNKIFSVFVQIKEKNGNISIVSDTKFNVHLM